MKTIDRARNLTKFIAIRFHKEFGIIGSLPNSEEDVHT